jgi:transcriptional regulator with PAS, ATPase and Fis domain
MVASGDFRQDLFYRINVMVIQSPPLRYRTGDIEPLALHFVTKYSALHRKAVENIEPEALEWLQYYSWPGNVRELENTIQHAVIMSEGYSIGIEHLPAAIQNGEPDSDASPEGSFEYLLRAYKIKLVNDAIQQCNGNKTLAAQSLSISRAYLHRLTRPEPVFATNVTDIRGNQVKAARMSRAAAG